MVTIPLARRAICSILATCLAGAAAIEMTHEVTAKGDLYAFGRARETLDVDPVSTKYGSAEDRFRGAPSEFMFPAMLEQHERQRDRASAYQPKGASPASQCHCHWSTSSFVGGIAAGAVGALIAVAALSSGRLAAGQKERKDSARQHASERSESGQNTPSHSSGDAVDEFADAPATGRAPGSLSRFWPRCFWLIGSLLLQSLSSIILAGFESLIREHPSIIYFLTMLVGLGGNVGGQSVVLTVRRLALGDEVSIREQVWVGAGLIIVLAPIAFVRALAQHAALSVCIVIGLSTIFIGLIAAALGTALPMILHMSDIDPGHSAPIIQVLMDMIGILIVCLLGHVVVNLIGGDSGHGSL